MRISKRIRKKNSPKKARIEEEDDTVIAGLILSQKSLTFDGNQTQLSDFENGNRKNRCANILSDSDDDDRDEENNKEQNELSSESEDSESAGEFEK